MEKNYKVVCQPLDLVLLVKHFDLKEERDLYSLIKEKFNTTKEAIRVDSYKTFILEEFLVDHEALSSVLPEDEEEQAAIINAVYDAVVSLYVPFKLELICAEVNNSLFFESKGIKELFEKTGKTLLSKVVNDGGELSDEVLPSGIHSIEDVNLLHTRFKDNIVGQKEAITSVINGIKVNAAGLSKHTSFLFVGPTGVGKTQLSKILGKHYSGDFYKINCAEYASGHEYAKLIGSPPGYVGHSEKSLLGEKADISNRWVFIFDEIEKAHDKFYDFLLSLLDDGTCTDNLGNVLDFSESVFIFTSNQGSSEVNYGKKLGFGSGQVDDMVSFEQSKDKVLNSVKTKFPPEFLNRIDSTILFNALSKEDITKIVELQLEEVPIESNSDIVDYIVDQSYSVEYGARNIARFIKNKITTKVADAILNKKVPKKKGSFYKAKIEENEIVLFDLKKYRKRSRKSASNIDASGVS